MILAPKPLLSLCIATYNQPHEVERLLQSILPQLRPGIEIIIRDDSTDDKTASLVRSYEEMSVLRYIHGAKGGVDRAVISLVEEAQGEYILLLGDDEVAENGIEIIINTLKNSRPDFLLLNYIPAGKSETAFRLGKSRMLKSGNEVIQGVGGGLGYLSAYVLRSSLAKEGIESAHKHIGTEFVTLYLALFVLSRSSYIYYLDIPCIIFYPTPRDVVLSAVIKNGKIYNRAFEIFGVNFTSISNEFKSYFDEKALSMMLKKNFSSVWRGMLVGWVEGCDTPYGKRLKFLKVFWCFPECWIALPLFFLPLSLNKALFRFYKIFFAHRHLRILSH